MKTSQKEYNELLYIINDPNNERLALTPLNEDGYPIINPDKIYCYYVNKECLFFNGTQEDLEKEWPDPTQMPLFYERVKDNIYRIPSDEQVYNINLNTREVETPEYLSILEDHNAEVIWFKADRFYDDVDLFGATCWIQYKNADGESYVTVTLPKVIAESDHDKLYIPWPITNSVAKATGNVSFSFKFFKIGEDKRVYFSLHTKPAVSKILLGLDVKLDEFLQDDKDDSKIDPQYSEFIKMYQELTNAYTQLSGEYNLYWLEEV